MQSFGSGWTLLKLDAVEAYLQSYTTALKNRKFHLSYIDAFCGSGNSTLNDGTPVEGSALRALRYPFDQYYFLDTEKAYCDVLREKIDRDYPGKSGITKVWNVEANEQLSSITEVDWLKRNRRGVIFLDPYAMQLAWSSLEAIAQTKALDVWYLFPYGALTRNLRRNGKVQPEERERVTRILGASDWEEEIYAPSPQMSFLEEPNLEKKNADKIREYILKRLGNIFPAVSPNAAFLRISTNTPLFLLCFASSNPNQKATELSLRIANHIPNHIHD